jgi:hypothetical protein
MDLQELESSKHALWRIVYYYTQVFIPGGAGGGGEAREL